MDLLPEQSVVKAKFEVALKEYYVWQVLLPIYLDLMKPDLRHLLVHIL